MLSERRDLAAARRFFKRTISTNGVPERCVIDKSGANLAGLQAVNVILKFTGNGRTVEIRQVKYLNNILEQDHRFGECPVFCVWLNWSMLPERSKDDDDFQRTPGRTFEGLCAA